MGSNQSKKENSQFKTMATAVNSDKKKKGIWRVMIAYVFEGSLHLRESNERKYLSLSNPFLFHLVYDCCHISISYQTSQI